MHQPQAGVIELEVAMIELGEVVIMRVGGALAGIVFAVAAAVAADRIEAHSRRRMVGVAW